MGYRAARLRPFACIMGNTVTQMEKYQIEAARMRARRTWQE